MPSVKNPNVPSRNRLAARAAKAKKHRQKESAAGKLSRSSGVSKRDAQRGARPGLLPTSGPRAALSAKKQRKVEKRLAHALRRKMEGEGEVVMKDASGGEKKTAAKGTDKSEPVLTMDIS